ncbi:MAG TPA: O-antigen ligase family protein, partial [Terriglobales bacterium]
MQAGSLTIARFSRLLVLALVPCTALAYFPPLASPFFAAKTTVLVLGVTVLLSLAILDRDFVLPAFPGPSRFFVYAVSGFLLVALVSAALSPWRYMTAPSTAWLFAGPLLWFLSIRVLRQERSLFPEVAAISGALVSCIAILQFALGRDFLFLLFDRSTQLIAGRMQFFSTLGNPNFVATYAAACLPFALVMANPGSSKRYLGLLASIPMLAAMVFSGSRAGLLAMMVGALTVNALTAWNRRTRAIIVALLVLFGLGLVFSSNYRSVSESFHGRVLIWRATLGSHWLSPTGTGPGTFAYGYPVRLGEYITVHPEEQRYAGREDHAQNDLVEFWSELGLFGAMAGMVLLGAAVKQFQAALSEDRQSTGAAAGCVAAILTGSLFDFPLHRPEIWVLFWLALAVPFSIPDSPPATARFPAL